MTVLDVVQLCSALPDDETPFICLSYGTMSYFRFLTTDAVLLALQGKGFQ